MKKGKKFLAKTGRSAYVLYSQKRTLEEKET